MLHPTKNEDGDIDDVDAMDAFIHFASIFWKLLFFTVVPPPHYASGWACFGFSLTMIGVCTFVVGDFANLLGCTMYIKTTVTAISFVALGTSLPDTFASMTAAVQDKYADPALGNVTGSNAVNVMLGLGTPWLISSIYDGNNYPATFENNGYYVQAGALGFSVIVFTTLAITCIIFIVARRYTIGAELGGKPFGRKASCIFLCTLWLIYIILSTLQAYEVGIKNVSLGIDQTKVHRLDKCWTKKQIDYLKTATEAPWHDGTTKKFEAGFLYEHRLGISKCINTWLKAKKKDKTLEAPKDGSCGNFLV